MTNTTVEAVARAIDEALKPYIEYIAKGLSRNAFPMDEQGELQNWSSWIARRCANEAIAAYEATKADDGK